ncbi:hypothetical protein C6497_06435 [Candidatus Poribacteria bacterium]|nr:MAG: hypothetical protein C6497_06435 [Candidatus Poribacteria bacterium]
MLNLNEYIDFINEFKTVSPTITDEQRIGLLRRGIQQHGLSMAEAENIILSSGLIIGEQIDYFNVLGLSIEYIQNQNEDIITAEVDLRHRELYNASLKAGGRIRSDGRTEEQWRIILNEARDTLKNVEKRISHIEILQTDVPPPTEILSEDIPLQETDTIQETIATQPSEQSSVLPSVKVLPEDESIKGTDTLEECILSQPIIEDGMALIPAGEFQMGSEDNEAYKDEKPLHTVYIDTFYIDKYPVTNAEYREFINANPEWGKPKKWHDNTEETSSIHKKFHDGDYLKNWNRNKFRKNKDHHPVTWVSWYAAMAYAQWKGKRLPTEAEWEKAARGGLEGMKYPWGNTLSLRHLNNELYISNTTEVGQYPENGFGIYDMAGNVFEWCIDLWDENYYTNSPYNNPIADGYLADILADFASVITPRVVRGGSFVSTPRNTRVSYRHRNTPDLTSSSIGFRCVRSK